MQRKPKSKPKPAKVDNIAPKPKLSPLNTTMDFGAQTTMFNSQSNQTENFDEHLGKIKRLKGKLEISSLTNEIRQELHPKPKRAEGQGGKKSIRNENVGS